MRTELAEAEIAPYLERLEAIVDPEHVARTHELQARAFAYEPVDHAPTMIIYPIPEDEWPDYNFQEIYDDPGKMLLHELRDIYAGAKLADDRLYGIRANYGTGIISAMFGCRTVTFEDSLPIGLAVSEEQLDRVLEAGTPPLRGGPHSELIERALDTVAYYRETLAPYSKLASLVGSQMLDIQGPFDNASIIWGSSLYYAFYDDPEKLHALMGIIVDTIRAAIDQTPPELIADLMEHGIALAGGGALLKGLAQRLTEETRMKVYVATDPLSCVARGSGMVLEHFPVLQKTLASMQRGSTLH